MKRLVLIGALLESACGSATDDRPPTLDYITETILAPSCASAECHSAFKREVGDQFDTPEAARFTMVAYHMVLPGDAEAPEASLLVRTLTVGSPSILDPGSGNIRMPYDAPLPDRDIELIKTWISMGSPGAQCAPNQQQQGCSVTTGADGSPIYKVVACPDGNIGATIMTCASNEACDTATGNGKCVRQ
jgi:hypothetical protein